MDLTQNVLRGQLVAMRYRIDSLIRVLDGDPVERARVKKVMDEAQASGKSLLEAALADRPVLAPIKEDLTLD